MKMFNLKKLGFTMIELLIVIAVLGILAVAVLSAINPIEQINRGKDTGSRSDVEQLLSATERFYAAKGWYPWMVGETVAGGNTPVVTPIKLVTDVNDNDSPAVNMLTKLSTGGTSEVKTSFTTRLSSATYNPLYLYSNGDLGDSVYICFNPKSASFREEAVTRCGVAGAGLPPDLLPMKETVCAGGAEMICLP